MRIYNVIAIYMEKFNAKIKKIEDKDGTYVEMPFDVENAFGAKRVKVKATFDGIEYRGSIVRMGMPCYIIGITKEIRNKIGKEAGDIVEVTIVKDDEERIIDIPEDVRLELKKEKNLQRAFDSLSFSNKRKYINSITSAKKEETRRKRIGNLLEELKEIYN